MKTIFDWFWTVIAPIRFILLSIAFMLGMILLFLAMVFFNISIYLYRLDFVGLKDIYEFLEGSPPKNIFDKKK